jgi:uncharacterized protein (TIGR03437 family)
MKRTYKLYRTAALLLTAGSYAFAQNAPVPAAYQATYTELQSDISSFDATVTASWNGKPGNVLWSAELLTANANLGLALLKAQAGVTVELNELRSLGAKAVTVNIAFPILTQAFYTYNGDPQDYASMVAFYSGLAKQIHGMGMKMIVESAEMFLGGYTANSGFNLTGYYASLSDTEFVAARVENIYAVATQVGPDYINLNSEPDTDLQISGRTALYGTPTNYANMNASIIQSERNMGVTIPLGAGIGTWLADGAAQSWVSALLGAGISFLDLHIYLVNFGYLPAAITYANMAQAAGIPVGISEAWLFKENSSQLEAQAAGTSVGNNSTYEALDPFSFWAPLDQAFLKSLADFANWKGLIYESPFWTQYFASYLDYSQYGSLPAATVTADAQTAAAAALQANQSTPTGSQYRTSVMGASTFSAASYALGGVAPSSMVAIFGANLAPSMMQAAAVPLPTSLQGTTATIQDSAGTQQPVPFYFVSSGQINAEVPPGLASGPAVITISNNGTAVAYSYPTIAAVSPALFTANETGQGPPLAIVVTMPTGGGSQTYSTTYTGGGVGSYTAAPILLSGTGTQTSLVLFGTGIRGASGLGNVTATIGSTTLPVQYAGPIVSDTLVGLDQVNVALPASLEGSGAVNLTVTVNGVASNTVSLDFQ